MKELKCNKCLAHYPKGINHICSQWIVDLVKLSRLKDLSCLQCGKKLAKYKQNGKWDGHSYYHKCGCVSKDMITSIG